MNNLKRLRTDKHLTVRELSELVKINYATLSRLENGDSQFNNEYIRVLSSFFNVTSDYLLGFDDSKISNVIIAEEIPVYSTIYGGDSILRKEKMIGYECAPTNIDLKDCIYLVANNDFISVRIFKGDLLLLKQSSEVSEGLFVVARKNEPGIVRKIVDLENEWICLADNNMPSKLDNYQVLGKVLMVSRKL